MMVAVSCFSGLVATLPCHEPASGCYSRNGFQHDGNHLHDTVLGGQCGQRQQQSAAPVSVLCPGTSDVTCFSLVPTTADHVWLL